MSQFPATWSVILVSACALSAAGEGTALDAAYLGSEAQIALLPPEQLPEPPGAPVPLPPVETRAVDGACERSVADGCGLNEGGDDFAPRALTLEDAEALAVAFHPAVREASGRVRAARGNWVQVGLRPNPEIGYQGEEVGDAGTAGKQGGFVAKEFVTAGKLRLNRSVASQEVAAAQQRLETARLQVLTTVRILYFEMLAARRGVELARQLRGLADESVRVSELRLKALDIPKVSLLQSQVERESTALLEQQAHERYQSAWRRLSTAIGVNDREPPPMDDTLLRPLPELEWEPARARVLAESPELAELQFAVARARWAVQRASAGRVPNVDVEAGVAHDNATEDTIANVRVSMPLPVFDRNQGAIVQACGELAAARAALEERELALEQRLAAAMRDYATARQRAIKYSETILPVARQSLDMVNLGYREGELDYLAVLSAQQTYAQTNISYLQALETAWTKWAEIEGLLTGPLPEQRN